MRKAAICSSATCPAVFSRDVEPVDAILFTHKDFIGSRCGNIAFFNPYVTEGMQNSRSHFLGYFHNHFLPFLWPPHEGRHRSADDDIPKKQMKTPIGFFPVRGANR